MTSTQTSNKYVPNQEANCDVLNCKHVNRIFHIVYHLGCVVSSEFKQAMEKTKKTMPNRFVVIEMQLYWHEVQTAEQAFCIVRGGRYSFSWFGRGKIIVTILVLVREHVFLVEKLCSPSAFGKHGISIMK